ncbi:DUF4270 family protein [Hymenobacter rigui]|uniref:DUF4270 family protein n=1 Tax=Hymenobacter rigui TaxID=334424 RepID=A0A3R9MKF5_9BACT|nr:DUF4270 family protein [Hymenobacter rigui]RSK47963.1 DUF4270 family protein [Hymenobacter rigui]
MNWPTSASRLASVSLAAVSLLSLATGCDNANDLGLELPGTSPITANYLDLPVKAFTVRQQPIETVKANHVLVGRLRDTYVGTTTASGYLNIMVEPILSPSDSLPAKFTNVSLDSTVFSLAFDQVYGSATQPLRLDLLTLQAPLDERTVYNSTSTVATGTTLLTNFEGVLNRTRPVKRRVASGTATDTTTTVITTQVADQVVRIRMQKYPGTAALANTVFTSLSDAAFNQSKLDAVWKGIALRPSAGHTANIVGFTRSANTRITFYFRGTDAAGVRSKYRSYSLFLANIPAGNTLLGQIADGKYFTQLSTDLSGTPLAALTTTQSTLPAAASSGFTYAQEGVGLGTRIEFQGLDDLRNNTSLAINRAELLLPVKQYSNGIFPYPEGLYLYEVNNANEVLTRTVGATTYERIVPGEGLNSSTQVRLTPTSVGAGSYARATVPAGQDPTQYFSVPLTEYLQAYLQNRLDGDLPSGLILSPILRSSSTLNLNRAQFDASNIKLRVYYSKLR